MVTIGMSSSLLIFLEIIHLSKQCTLVSCAIQKIVCDPIQFDSTAGLKTCAFTFASRTVHNKAAKSHFGDDIAGLSHGASTPM